MYENKDIENPLQVNKTQSPRTLEIQLDNILEKLNYDSNNALVYAQIIGDFLNGTNTKYGELKQELEDICGILPPSSLPQVDFSEWLRHEARLRHRQIILLDLFLLINPDLKIKFLLKRDTYCLAALAILDNIANRKKQDREYRDTLLRKFQQGKLEFEEACQSIDLGEFKCLPPFLKLHCLTQYNYLDHGKKSLSFAESIDAKITNKDLKEKSAQILKELYNLSSSLDFLGGDDQETEACRANSIQLHMTALVVSLYTMINPESEKIELLNLQKLVCENAISKIRELACPNGEDIERLEKLFVQYDKAEAAFLQASGIQQNVVSISERFVRKPYFFNSIDPEEKELTTTQVNTVDATHDHKIDDTQPISKK